MPSPMSDHLDWCLVRCKHAEEDNKKVNKHDKINGSGRKRCTKATQPFVKERNKIDQPPYVYVLQLFEVVSFITF